MIKSIVCTCTFLLMVVCIRENTPSAELTGNAVPSPPNIAGMADYRGNLLVMPDTSWHVYSVVEIQGVAHVTVKRSFDNGVAWSETEDLIEVKGSGWGGAVALLDRDDEVHLFILKWRWKDGRKPAVDRFIDIWHMRSYEGRSRWLEPQCIFKGYCGSIQSAAQLRSGRIILPFAKWVADRGCAPHTGCNVTTAVYSDDGGETWTQSVSELSAPCYTNFNGNNYGAVEPAILELADGRVWMLVRTQTGYLYESFSRDGDLWEPLKPSRFHSSTSPAFMVRTENNNIVLFWNNCEMPPRVDGNGVYGGRDVLSAALSADEGRTWLGYREVYRDPARNETPPKRGDRGTAYPFAVAMKDGRIALVSGQGEGKCRLIIVEPDWLLERSYSDDFTHGLENWSVFKSFGPAEGWWRDRAQGPHLAECAEFNGKRALLIRKPDNRAGDCAVWNFPASQTGILTVQLKPENGFGGASIVLTDRFFNPDDINGERKALFNLKVDNNGNIPGGGHITLGKIHAVTLTWNIVDRFCRIIVDGNDAALLPLLNDTVTGACYLRLSSTSNSIDPFGWYAGPVDVHTGVDVLLSDE